MRRILALSILAILVLAGWLVWPWVEAGRVLYDLVGRAELVASVQTVLYTVGDRHHSGDLYAPYHPSGVGLVIVPGAAELGKDDPRLRRFAAVLAHAGFTVLVPEIPTQMAMHVGPENIDDVADAADWLAARQKRVGAAAISYGVGPAILAALREGDKLHFLVGVGGYDDLTAVIGFFTTGWYFEDGHWEKRMPNAYGKWVFVKSNAARLTDSGDRTLLDLMAERRMADPQAPLDGLARRLTSTGRSIYDLLANGDPVRVPALIDNLPPSIRDDILALDLRGRDLSGLKAHLLLIHGQGDAIIPAGESRKLAAAVPSARLFLVDDLAHADWTPGKIGGMFTLLRATRALLAERELR
jgi:pimeloyl-ACP methyl ester carboxylesterase